MGFWDTINNAIKNAGSDLQAAEQEALREASYLSKRQLEEKIKNCGNSLTELKKKSVYMNELENRR